MIYSLYLWQIFVNFYSLLCYFTFVKATEQTKYALVILCGTGQEYSQK